MSMDKFRSVMDLLGIKAPDIRAWVALGCFILVYKVLDLVGKDRTLLTDPAFMAYVGVLTGGTVIVVVQNMFGGTKSGVDTNAALAKVAATGGTGAGT